jgi:ribosomal protein S18 acetylase RimI-like enzyme
LDIREDHWLAERFGHPVFTVSIEQSPGGIAGAVREHASAQSGASYQARVPSDRQAEAEQLRDAGFREVSTGILLARVPDVPEAAGLDAMRAGQSGVEVRAARPRADDAILEVAERSFSRSRFHLDPEIPDAVANRIKRDWAASCLEGRRGDGMLVAVREGAPVGFLAVVAGDAGGRAVRTIDLIAVDPAQRDQGIGEALVARFLRDSTGACDRVQVATQAANPDATRFYERLGFAIAEETTDLHMHLPGAWAED